MVFYESPHRLADALVDAAAAFGADRPAAVCRELTKTYEEIRRGARSALATWAAEVAAEEAAGADRKEAIRAVMGRTGLPRRVVYDAVVAAKGS
jgi:16S rRNA (cytidine1402-2'-O)-methyltransferase